MKWGTVGARRCNYIYIYIVLFFLFGCRACAWTGTAPGVLGRPSHPPSSYHPKGGSGSHYEETAIIASAHPAMATAAGTAGTAGARLRAAPAVAAIAEVQA